MSEKTPVNGRRRFLKTAALAGGAATVAVAAGAAVTDEPQPAGRPSEEGARGKQGYRLTPHIDTYYRLARQ